MQYRERKNLLFSDMRIVWGTGGMPPEPWAGKWGTIMMICKISYTYEANITFFSGMTSILSLRKRWNSLNVCNKLRINHTIFFLMLFWPIWYLHNWGTNQDPKLRLRNQRGQFSCLTELLIGVRTHAQEPDSCKHSSPWEFVPWLPRRVTKEFAWQT